MSKIILVTGANAGIGFELTRQLAGKNHIVYLGARNEVAGKEATEKLSAEGLKTVKFVLIDVTKTDSIKAAKETIESAEGKLDVLINNAGIANLGANQNALTIDIETIRGTVETNLYGTIQTTQAFVPLLRKSSNGIIVNVTSDMASNGFQAGPGIFHCVAYNTSKAAMNSYSIALAAELKKDDIKVNLVTPGFTSTKLNFFGEGGRSISEGAASIVPWALLEKDGPTGKFYGPDGKEFPW